MGEPAYLRRSFSHPSDASSEAAPGDPIRALTESVSFGRFMSESLAWEKWSTFSHNRYLEEVEKFSKPGSVAEKRAYFEAHYKKKAAARATSQVEEVGEPNFDVPGKEDIHTQGDVSTGESELAKADTLDAHDENQKKDSVEALLASSGDTNESNPVDERSKLEIARAASPENVKYVLAEKNLSPSEGWSHFDKPEFTANSMTSQDNNVPDKVPVNQHILTSCEKKQALSSSKSSTRSRTPRLPLPHKKAIASMQPRDSTHVNIAVSNSQTQTDRSSVKENRLSPKSLHMSINFASLSGSSTKLSRPQFLQVRKNEECTASPKTEKDNFVAQKAQTQVPVDQHILTSSEKKQALSSSKSSTRSRMPRLPLPHKKAIASMQPRGSTHVNNAVSNSQTQTDRSSVKENRLSPKSLHMSINFASLSGSSTKLSRPRFLRVRKNEECTASPKIEKDNSVAQKAQTQASLRKSVCSAVIPASRDRSSKCSSINGSKARSTTVCSPFSFRSEERAAKRKEKQEEKYTSLKAEVQPLQTYKGKAEQDIRKLQHGFGFKAKKNDESCRGSRSPSAQSKCSLTRPRPSKFESQPTSDKCLNTRSRPSQRIKIDADSSNHVNCKISRSSTNHQTFLSQKKVHENASPNIQL